MDGTFYHLWYLPATLIGISLVYIIYKYCSLKLGFILVIILYIIGLGGDSYYGSSIQIPILKSLYNSIFQFCEYTRNGLFFAPIFLWLGAYIAQHQRRISRYHWYITLCISFLFMAGETIILNSYNIPKHDAMNIFLPMSMYLLFMIIISYTGQRYPRCKDLSLMIYIIHPMMIVVTRMLGKILHLETYFIDNHLIHFCIVTLLSIICSYIFIFIKKGMIQHGKTQVPNRSKLG